MSDRDGFLGQFDTIQSLTQTGVVGPNFPDGFTLGRDAVAGNEALSLKQAQQTFMGFMKNAACFEQQSQDGDGFYASGNYIAVPFDTQIFNSIQNCYQISNTQVVLPPGIYMIRGRKRREPSLVLNATKTGQLFLYNASLQSTIINGFSFQFLNSGTPTTSYAIIREVFHPYLQLSKPTAIEVRLNVNANDGTGNVQSNLSNTFAQLFIFQWATS